MRVGPLPAFVALYGMMYAAFGVASPFWSLFFSSRGLSPEQIGTLLALGTLARLLVGPFVGRITDIVEAPRTTLAVCAALAVLAALGLIPAQGYLLIAISVCHAAALTPNTTIADALAVNAATRSSRFEYGWVRGAGSAAFVMGTLLAGQVLSNDAVELSAIVWMHATLLSAVVVGATLVPGISLRSPDRLEIGHGGVVMGGLHELMRNQMFFRVLVISGLVFGSHAMHDAFAIIRWNSAGLGPAISSILWSEAVVAEVAVFLFLGPFLINRVGAKGAAILAASAGAVRWVVMSQTTDVAALAIVQPLHGFTFALLHLACMGVIGASVPSRLATTAQSIYAFGGALASAFLSYLSGILYGEFGAPAFLIMAVLCLLAIPIAFSMARVQSA